MASLLVHVMDALLQKGVETQSGLALRKSKLQVTIDFLDGDFVLNAGATSEGGGKVGVCFDAKLQLDLPRLGALADVYDAANADRFFLRFSLLRLAEKENPPTDAVPLATAIISPSTVNQDRRKECIVNLINTLAPGEVLARLRVGLLMIDTKSDKGRDLMKEFYESPSSSQNSRLLLHSSSRSKAAATPASSIEAPAVDPAESSLSKREYAKRVEAGNNVLAELQALVERLDQKEPRSGELVVPINVFVDFVRTRVNVSAAREVREMYRAKLDSTPVVVPPDVVALFEGGLSSGSLPALLFSSVSVFVARRLRISTGATAVAETREIASSLKACASDVDSIAKVTTELQLFFAKGASQSSAEPESKEIPLNDMDMTSFVVVVERNLQEIEACILAEWGEQANAKHAASQGNRLIAFFADKLRVLSEAVERKSDETLKMVEREHDLAWSAKRADKRNFHHMQILREYRRRIKKQVWHLQSMTSSDPQPQLDDELPAPSSPVSTIVPAHGLSRLAKQVVDALSKRIHNRALVSVERTLGRVIGSLHPVDSLLAAPTSPRRDFAAAVRVGQMLSAMFSRLVQGPREANQASLSSAAEAEATEAAVSRELIAVVVKAAEDALLIAKDASPQVAARIQRFLDCTAPIRQKEVVESPPSSTSSSLDSLTTVMEHADRLFSRAEVATLEPLDPRKHWMRSERDVFIVLAAAGAATATVAQTQVSDVFEAFMCCGDGVSIFCIGWVLADPECRSSCPALELATFLGKIFCGSSVSGLPFDRDSVADKENSLLSRACKLVTRCTMIPGGTKIKLPVAEMTSILDSDPQLEATEDLCHGKNLLHLAAGALDVDPVLIKLLLSRRKGLNPRQIDQFGKSAFEYCASRSDLLQLWLDWEAHCGTEPVGRRNAKKRSNVADKR